MKHTPEVQRVPPLTREDWTAYMDEHDRLRAENARQREALQGLVRAIIQLASGRRFTAERRDAVETARAALAAKGDA